MSTVAFRASLVREIEQAMQRADEIERMDHSHDAFLTGQVDAYAHILMLIKDEVDD
jgi:hypothetical protein